MDPNVAAEHLRKYFDAHPDGIVCAYLFGSTARGTARGGSDVDIAVLLDQDPPPTLEGSGLRLGAELERQLGLPVDIVLLASIMVDRDLILKRLAFIETCVHELRTLARLDALDRDIREERFVVHGYETVDLRIVRDVVATRLDDLVDFASSIRARLARG